MKTGARPKIGGQDGSIGLSKPYLYLFTLEVEPLRVGGVFDELPLHCTLMHRFYSELSADELGDNVRSLFDKTPQVLLTAYKHTKLGPKQVPVSLIKLTEELDKLNMQVYNQLNKLEVEYTTPQWVGKGHVFHVTDRIPDRLEINEGYVSKAAYLIEVVDHKRIIRQQYELGGQTDVDSEL
jgi:hypothetical protein